MRAKTINETQRFERASDPKTAMGVGKVKRIKELLDQKYNDHMFLTYKIVNPDHIEIFYKDPEKFGDPEIRRNAKWILKYIEVDRFVLNNKYTETFYNTPMHYDKWTIYENSIYNHDFPKELKIEPEFKFDVGDFKDKGVKEMAEYIVNCLNEKYPKVDGFELIERFPKPKEE